jgi:DNA-binding MarR family transcriptional regulator
MPASNAPQDPYNVRIASLIDELEQIVLASVALTAQVLAAVAPDLTFLQWRILVILGTPAYQEGISVGQIAAELGAKLPATSRVLSRLRSRGLVDVTPDPNDRRVRVVRLSDPGSALRVAVTASRRSELAWAVESGRLAIADAGAARRIAHALERLR